MYYKMYTSTAAVLRIQSQYITVVL